MEELWIDVNTNTYHWKKDGREWIWQRGEGWVEVEKHEKS